MVCRLYLFIKCTNPRLFPKFNCALGWNSHNVDSASNISIFMRLGADFTIYLSKMQYISCYYMFCPFYQIGGVLI